MKLLTHNFLNCAAKTCKSSPDSFPLKFEEVELVSVEVDYNPQFLINVLPRVDWPALIRTAVEVRLSIFGLKVAWKY
jgi:multifunctional methyltransferase subunit TRM112